MATTTITFQTPATNDIMLGKATETDPCRVGCIDNPNARILRIVHISDTYLWNDMLSLSMPSGDILVHSGNFFRHDNSNDFLQNMSELDKFFAAQPHSYKV